MAQAVVLSAWHVVQGLGIRVEIPFTLTTSDGRTEIFEGRVMDFGGPNGVVLAA